MRTPSLTLDCGGGTCLRGNGDSRIRANETPVNGSQVHEDLLVWTHLASSGFLKGDYRMADGESLPTDANSPKNPYQIYLQIVFDGRYGISDGGTPRHNLKTGANPGRSVLQELDRKVDDGKPYKGALQFSTYQGNGAPSPTEGGADGLHHGAGSGGGLESARVATPTAGRRRCFSRIRVWVWS